MKKEYRVSQIKEIAESIPKGYEGCIRPRSGNALKKGLTVLNTPGTIDANHYRRDSYNNGVSNLGVETSLK